MATKRNINKNTECIRIKGSRFFRYKYVDGDITFFTNENGNFVYDAKESITRYGYANTKKEFVNKVYEFIGG